MHSRGHKQLPAQMPGSTVTTTQDSIAWQPLCNPIIIYAIGKLLVTFVNSM